MRIKSVKNRTEGITLIALSITIVLMLILAGVVVYSGGDTIKRAQLEELKTNMLLIQAKAKEYVEDATFKMGIEPDDERKTRVREEVYRESAQLQKAEVSEIPSSFGISDVDKETCYWLTPEAQKSWGLDKIQLKKDEKYLIKFDEDNVTVEVYNSLGYDSKYSLTDIDQINK